MDTVIRVIIGLIITAVGGTMVVKTIWYLNFFGDVSWAEEKLGGGGSNLFYKLLGIVLCLLGFMVTLNLWDAFLNATVGSFLPAE